jgi:aspartate kinase
MIMRRNLVGRAISTLEIALLGRGMITEVTAEMTLQSCAVMGANMKGTRGVASKVFSTVAKRGA